MIQTSEKRTRIFKKVITLKRKQKSNMQKLRQCIRQLETTNISMTDLSRLPRKQIIQNHEQQNRIMINMTKEILNIKTILRESSSLQTKYLEISAS